MELRSRLKKVKLDILFLQVSVFLLIVLSVLQVFTRYVLNAPLSWTEELSTWVLIWMTYVGAYTLLYRDGHARVEVVDDIFDKRITRWAHTVWDAVTAAFLIVFAYAGIKLMDIVYYDKTPALRVSYSVIMCIIPIVSLLMFFTLVRRIYRTVNKQPGGR